MRAHDTTAGIPDEAAHLAAVMRFLGYRHVVATMWPIADRWAASITDATYAGLRHQGVPDAPRTARALHQAISDLRERFPTLPVLWVPVHTRAPACRR
jgi:hypothetical protein